MAAAAALREPALVAGLILVNPATAFGQRPGLQADAAKLRSVPAPLFAAASFALLGRKTFDLGFVANAVKDILVERKLETLRASDPALARYFDGALGELMQQVSALPPREFMLDRLEFLRVGCEKVEGALPSLEPPLLVIAGTADVLLDSEAEAGRLQRLLGSERCTVSLVPGAGHAGTLDQRCELPRVLEQWTAASGVAMGLAKTQSAA